MERDRRPTGSSGKKRAGRHRRTSSGNIYWDFVAHRDRESDEEGAEHDPTAATLRRHRRASSLDLLESPVMHTMPGVDYVPDTPEEDVGLAAASGATAPAAAAVYELPASTELLKQALRKSAGEGRGAAATAPGAAAGLADAGSLRSTAAGNSGCVAAAVAAAPSVSQPVSSSVQAAPQAALPLPLAQQQLWHWQQQQAQQPQPSFLAGAKAALQEASAAGSQPGKADAAVRGQQLGPQAAQRGQQPAMGQQQLGAAAGRAVPGSAAGAVEVPTVSMAAPADLLAAAGALAAAARKRQQPARPGQAPQLALRRSPHAAAAAADLLPAVPSAMPAAAGGRAALPPAAECAARQAAAETSAAAAAAAAADRTPQAQLVQQRTPAGEQVPPSGRTDGASTASDMDEDFFNRIASLERKATLASSHQEQDQQLEQQRPQQAQQGPHPAQQQQEGQQARHAQQHAQQADGQHYAHMQSVQQQQHQQHQPLSHSQRQQRQDKQQGQQPGLGPAAGAALRPATLKVPLSAEAPKTGWSDTPDSACLAALDQMEQQAAGRLGAAAAAAEGAAGNAGAAAGSPVPARQLSFTPNANAGRAAAAAAAAAAPAGVTPLSGGSSRGGQLPTSHLGRSALQQAAAAQQQQQQQQDAAPPFMQQLEAVPLAAQQQQQWQVQALTAGQQQPQQQPEQHTDVASGWQQQEEQQQVVVAAAAVGLKRSLAASIALEQVMAQHSPAAKQQQQEQQQQQQHLQGQAQLAAAPAAEEPASKRLRAGEQQHVAAASAQQQAAPLPAVAGQQQQQLRDAAGAAAPAPAGQAAAVAGGPPRTFEYCFSDGDESEDEEAERNLPLLSQYMQSAGRSPQQLRQQHGERQAAAAAARQQEGPAGAEFRSPGARGSTGAAAAAAAAAGAAGGSARVDGDEGLQQQQQQHAQQAEQGEGSPLLSADPAMLESYLSDDLSAAFRKASGIGGKLYHWQAECLTTPGVLHGKNLVYCAPTSGGKSLVAEVLMLRRIMTTNRPAMLVLPFVSICSEKSEHLSKVLGAIGKEVKEFFGGNHSQAALTQTTGVIVCTIEKANIIINRMLEDQSLGMLSCLVVDELHMVGEEERGYQLELLLTKLRYAAAACDDEDDDYLSEGLQIIGMSATLPNVDKVAKWLNAQLFVTNFRPVPLQSFLKQGLFVKDEQLEVVRKLEVPTGWDTTKSGDYDHVALLARETVLDGHSVLVFCGTKAACEHTARRAAKMLEIPERQLKLKGWAARQRPTRASLLEDLRRVPGGADPGLLESFAKGAAFHHAGLSTEERDIVEMAYRCGAVSVLCATSTLAAGVNLPARRVIIRHAFKGRATSIIDGTCYRQMAGRAGRAGIDTLGECILINQDIPVTAGERLFTSGAAPVQSCLVEDKKGMKRAMLEVVVSGVVVEPTDVERYIRCTLLSAMNDYEKVADTTIQALRWLGAKDHTFIYWDDASRTYQPTPFGKAVLASGLPPEVCLILKDDLARARQSFVMTTELHLTYLCVPITETVNNLDWKRFENMLGTLQGAEASVAIKVGVDRGFAMRVCRGIRGGALDGDKERICKRFWMALILTDVIAEVDLGTVMKKYAVGRGDIQGLQDKAARFASMVGAFCERLGWYDLEALIVKFQSRVLHGVRPEILALSEIPFVKAYTARLLYRAGLRTPEAVAAVENVDQIVSILANQQSANPDRNNKMLVRRQALKILRGARELLNRRARELREQAEQAFKLVQSADKAELAHGEARGEEEHGEEEQQLQQEKQQQQQPQQQDPGSAAAAAAAGRGGGAISAAMAAAAQADGGQAAAGNRRQAAGANSGRQATGMNSGRGGGGDVLGPGSGRSFQTAASNGGGGDGGSWRQRDDAATSAAAAAAAGGAAAATAAADGGSDGEEDALLEAPPEADLAPDAWQYGGKAGVYCLDTPDLVRQLCSILLVPAGAPAPAQQQHAQQQHEPQQQQLRYDFFGFYFDTMATGSAAGAAALLPKGPTAAQRRDHTVHDRQSADVGVRLEGVAISWRNGQAFYVPLHRRGELLAELAPLFAAASLEKVTWDLRSQLAALAKVLGPGVLGIPGSEVPGGQLALQDPLVDVRVAAWLSTPDEKKLKDENSRSMNRTGELFTLSDMLKAKGGQAVWAQATQGMQSSAAQLGQRRADAGRRAAQACKMWQLLRARLRGDELLPPLWRTEMPLVRVIVDMERAGLGINEAILNTEEPLLQRRIEELEGMACKEAGEEFNLGSPQEVSRILFEKMRLPPPPTARDLKSGGYSTGQEVLLELHEHPIARMIFEHRKLRTLLNRFVQGFKMHLVYAEPVAYPGGLVLKRIRGSINQTCADTGRLAMDEPNLQCVPKPRAFKVLLAPGEAGGGSSGGGGAGSGHRSSSGGMHAMRTANLRAAFVAPPGFLLLSADYRQIEFRLMAHFSGDAGLMRIFSDDDADPFSLLAAQWLGIPMQQVSQQQRDHAKQLTYGLLYGMGPAKLADELGCTHAEAKEAQEKFRRSLPGIEAWQNRVVADCRRLGYVETLAGRRRYLPDIKAASSKSRSAAERQAKNTVCQGSAADLAKAAMIGIHTQLARRLPPGSARLVLQIHDEFLLEVAEPQLHVVARLVRDIMEGVAAAVQLRVALRVRLAGGPSWGELQDVQLKP